jgi:hypothetical protein
MNFVLINIPPHCDDGYATNQVLIHPTMSNQIDVCPSSPRIMDGLLPEEFCSALYAAVLHTSDLEA